MANDPIIIEQTFNAPVSELWKAISDKKQMKKWYFDIAKFEPVAGFEFQFLGGDEEKKFLHLCKVTEVIPRKKLAYTWRYDGYDGNSLVTFTLKEMENSSKLTLTHEDLDTFPPVPELSKENFRTGWEYIIGTSLVQFLEPSNGK